MSCSGIDADGLQRIEIKLLHVGRRRLQDHLELVIVLQPVGVLAIAAVLGAARGLHIGGVPGLGPERAQRGGRMEGARADFHVVGLQDDAALIRPVLLQRQDQALERARRVEIVLPRGVLAEDWLRPSLSIRILKDGNGRTLSAAPRGVKPARRFTGF